ncbi:hypothetical protein [Chryseobacterium sp.]|uniref:hypothetical protein n=1 Tax=Chryseobacterium sp. TaxID=1871047 RepID=UPI0011C8071E|nr:hypothetical protein [Chryseobacterium sp.]TXF77772.1 hypothetical protein FUA25_07570 [Chryseobacterium sp.]
MKKIVLVSILLIMASMKSQSTDGQSIIDILPPAPSTYAFATYGFQESNLFEGKIRADIPILNYNTKNLTIPISFGYSTSGVKVDDIDNTLGQTWSFNVGGVISRVVNGPEDTTGTNNVTPNQMTSNNMLEASYYDFIKTHKYSISLQNLEYDIYNFNFLGNTGKFILDKNNQFILLTPSDLKIAQIQGGFKITDNKGIEFYFEAKEYTKNFSSSCAGSRKPSSTNIIMSWYLTKVVNPTGEEIYFEYADSSYSFDSSIEQNVKSVASQNLFSYNSSPCNWGLAGNQMFISATQKIVNNCYNHQINYVKNLIKISSNNVVDGWVSLIYKNSGTTPNVKLLDKIIEYKNDNQVKEEINLSYQLIAGNSRNFLTNITYSKSNQKYDFAYISPELLPSRLVLAQDLWGYYNHATNDYYFIPKNVLLPEGANRDPNPQVSKYGMLKRITYPTRGFTDFEYEQNSYYGGKKIIDNYQSFQETATYLNSSLVGSIYNHSKIFNSGSLDPDEDVTLYAEITNNGLTCSPSSHIQEDPHATLTLQNLDDGTIVNISGGEVYLTNTASLALQELGVQSKLVYFKLLPNTNYELKVSAFKCLDVSYEYLSKKSIKFNDNIDYGGVRIKSLISSDGNGLEKKRYYYNKYQIKNVSSGDIGATPQFLSNYELRTYCPDNIAGENGNPFPTTDCQFQFQRYNILKSSSLQSLFNSGGNNIYYRVVSESLGGDNFENGNIEHEFIINRDDYVAKIHGNNEYLTDFGANKWSNTGWNHGNETKIKFFEKNNARKIKEIEKKYIKKGHDNRRFHNIIIADLYDEKETCPEPFATLLNKSIGYYFLEAKTSQIDEEVEKEYVANGDSLTTIKKYYYASPFHYSPTKETVTFPDGNIEENNYSYAYEKNNQVLINKNMTGYPLETSTIRNTDGITKIISKTETVYPDQNNFPTPQAGNLILPLSIKIFDIQNPTISYTGVTYDFYDSKGNHLQYTTKKGVPVTIIWGYNQRFPIIKMVGAKYDEIMEIPYIKNIVSASDTDALSGTPNDESLFLTLLDNFRKQQIFKDYQITTYTYDPLIGVRSITPPSGIREVYIYDTANRLKEIREGTQTGNILKEFKYNYKP